MISIEGLTLNYGDHCAVRDMNLTVAEGEALVLLGQSGCGKTSAMRCVAGLEEPSAGRITLRDRVVFDSAKGIVVPSHKRNVGMVFQSYAVWPHRTVYENISFPLRMQGKSQSEIAAGVQEALATVGLSALADRGASLLSGGQMQRVALARSLAMRPSVLLLDEPLSNLDARLRERLRVELREIQQRFGLTWIYVTHDQVEALSLADRIGVMEDKRIVQLGTPEELYDRPATLSVAQFMGINNAFDAEIAPAEGGGRRFRIKGLDLVVDGSGRCQAATAPVVCIRSENILLNAPQDMPSACRWSGKVTVVNFQGAATQYQIAIAPGLVLDVLRPSSERPRARIGEAVRITVDPAHVLVFDRGGQP